jgi:hypothetical protein
MNLASLLLLTVLGSDIPSASAWAQNAPRAGSPLPCPGPGVVQRALPSAKGLKPGIYETAPYTSIVIVPRRHVDDGIFVRPREPVPSMPIITVTPELRFIPRNPRK